MNNEVYVSFWKINDDGENNKILSFSSNIYPNYKKGDVLFLKKDIAPNTPKNLNEDELRLTKFVVVVVHHAVEQNFMGNIPCDENPFPFKIRTFVSIDVYVQELSTNTE
jgi:hypothetical protein